MFVNSDQALDIAKAELDQTVVQTDAVIGYQSDVSLGQPVLVTDVLKTPSYWIVPLLIQEQVTGFARVLKTGQVTALGSFKELPNT